MTPLLLVGGGGHCRAVIDVVEAGGGYAVAGIVDGGVERGSAVLGHTVLGGDEVLDGLDAPSMAAIVTVGQIQSPAVRQRLFGYLSDRGFLRPVVISPKAAVSSHAVIGEGTVVMHLAFVGPSVRIGVNSIVNNRAQIEHDARIGDHCHISTAAILNGGVRVHDGSFIGSGAVIREGVTIGAGAVIGMGARVRRDVAAGSTIKGDA